MFITGARSQIISGKSPPKELEIALTSCCQALGRKIRTTRGDVTLGSSPQIEIVWSLAVNSGTPQGLAELSEMPGDARTRMCGLVLSSLRPAQVGGRESLCFFTCEQTCSKNGHRTARKWYG